ncbi:hypothetical protein [Rhodovulum sp. PH10]|uniref:hypothetical protein n=1 Tax=Rhodovulum sp. PH10 TaxID=1187851 RepID=UPI00059061DD|nr:hypothetical protein [Rhodovulum sp. PH10]
MTPTSENAAGVAPAALSEFVFAGSIDNSETTKSHLDLQVARLIERFSVPRSTAAVLASHVWGRA